MAQTSGTADATKEATKKAPKTRTQPEYVMQPVDEIPPSEDSRGLRYFELLSPMVEHPGQTYLIAHYATDAGASAVKRQLVRGKRTIPAGKWEFASRTWLDPDTGIRRSSLYGMYVGP